MQKLQLLFENYFIASVGAAFAIGVDFTVAPNHSLLRSFALALERVASFSISQHEIMRLAAVFLVMAGGASILYFRPLSRKGAFSCGFAAVAVLAIFAP